MLLLPHDLLMTAKVSCSMILLTNRKQTGQLHNLQFHWHAPMQCSHVNDPMPKTRSSVGTNLIRDFVAITFSTKLEMWVNAQRDGRLALCSTPQSLADAHY